ncbi:MAG: FmdB family transcriptional regulator [Microcella sp.]|uniref:FmdB family zinc ribbon protein n=1 Tax=Microcella sp. TaxID=1913979 RepID=UPI0024CB8355|nr:FmdB family zinc ribbon protein [Microcella sp.]UYN83530.1 MAG: FmdB family transcriptional regulator [Microcella sp.]
MPTYSYRCTECSVAFDIQQAFTDDSLTECPSCEGRLRKVFSAIGVTFNGSGFYRTDSRAGSDKKSSGEKTSSESSSKSSGEKAASSASGASSTTTSSPAPAAAT